MTHKHVWESTESRFYELLSKNPADDQYMQHLRKTKLEKETEKNCNNIRPAKKSEPMECCAVCSWQENSTSKYEWVMTYNHIWLRTVIQTQRVTHQYICVTLQRLYCKDTGEYLFTELLTYGIKSLFLMKSKITSFLDGVIFAFSQIKPLG